MSTNRDPESGPTRGRTLARGMVSLALGNGASKILLLLIEVVLARMLGVEQYGYYALSYSCLYVTTQLAIVGMNHGVLQFTAINSESGEMQRNGRVVGTGLGLVALASVILGAALCAGAELLATAVFSKPTMAPLLMLVAVIVPVETGNLCLSAAFRAHRRFTDHNMVIDLCRNVVMLVGLPVLYTQGLGVEAVLGLYLAGGIAGLLWGLVRIKLLLGPTAPLRLSGKEARELLVFSYPLIPWNVLQMAAHGLSVILAGTFLPSAEVGAVAFALRTLLVLNFLQGLVNMTAPGEFVRLAHRGERERLNLLYQGVSRPLLVVTSILTIPIFLGPEWVMHIGGQGFADHTWIIAPLLAAKALNVASGPGGQLLIAARQRWSMLAVTAVEAALQLGICIPLIWRFGLSGLVGAELLRVVLLVVVRQAVVRHRLGVHTFTQPWLRLALALVVALWAGTTFRAVVEGPVDIAGGIMVGFTTYLALVAWFVRSDAAIRDSVVGTVRALIGVVRRGPRKHPRAAKKVETR